ncbi:MAG: hypothetical protein IJP43_01525 [Oscillospiraceae bacterium]|nr:hypothetical protein [Oscillospiraceae bacterium]
MKKMNRFLCAVLSAVMVLGMIPALSAPAKAISSDKPDVDTTYAGKYYEAGIGSGGSAALIVNGEFGTGDLSIGGVGGKLSGNGKQADIDAYNMMNCFGIYNNKWLSKPADGFTYSGGQKINYGSGQYVDSLNVCTYNDKGGKTGSMTITIRNNPTLKALAESGKLQMYFKGYTSAGKEARKAWPDDHTYVWGWVKINGSTKGSSGKSKAEKKEFGTGGWVTVGASDVITIEWKVDKSAGKFSNGWADKDVGIGNCVLLFRKCEEPNLTGYTLTTNGDLSYGVSGNPEILLGNDGKISLDFIFSEAVKTSLSEPTRKNTDHYELLSQLGSRVLFNNTEGTGYYRQGDPVNMNLTGTYNTNGNLVSVSDSDDARVKALADSLKGMHFEWNAAYGDYYGDNPVPGEGDWIGLVSSNNTFSLIDSIILASFHDLAGNPLKIDGKLVEYNNANGRYTTELSYEKATSGFEYGKTYYYDEASKQYTLVDEGMIPYLNASSQGYYNKREILTGTVRLQKDGAAAPFYTKSGVINPFAVDTTDSSGFDFVIDAVSPTYSKTSNAVQPETLTDLVLNKGDGFDIYLNYSETVKLREFYADGSATGFNADNLCLKLSNGLIAKYVSGIGTKQLRFTVSVPAMYTMTVVQPEAWSDTYASYYVKNNDGYTKVSEGSNPQWAENTYYSYVADTNTDLEIESMYVEANGKQATLTGENLTNTQKPTASTYVLTDYVGNPLCEPIGDETYRTTMAWSKLKVDNTAPEIEIQQLDSGYYQIKVTESGSGVFRAANTTSGADNGAGIVYYVWVEGDEQAEKVKEAFAANNYEKVKTYSLTGGNDAKVTVDGKTYALTAVTTDKLIAPKTEAGEWHLVVFTADMTWDSARQLIQFGSSSYKNDPSGYLAKLAETLGVSFGDVFTAVKAKPDDWDTTYTNYYYQNGNTYSRFKEGAIAPVFEAGKIYKVGYSVLESEPAGWNPYHTGSGTPKYTLNADGSYSEDANGQYVYDESGDYTHYYIKSGDSYRKIARLTGVPAFESGKYYNVYTAVPSEDLATADLSAIFVRDADDNGVPVYVSVLEKYAPEFDPENTYDASHNQITSKPADWNTAYTGYFTKGTEYKALTGDAAPVFAANTYYKPEYTALASGDFTTDEETQGTEVRSYSESGEPEDTFFAWADVYGDYFVKNGDNYVKNESETYDSGTVYYRVTYTVLSAQPDDWDTAFASYCAKEDVYEPYTTELPDGVTFYSASFGGEAMSVQPEDWSGAFSYYSTSKTEFAPVKWIFAPEFEAGKYYSFTYVPAESEPEGWSENYNQFFVKSGENYIKLDLSSPSKRESVKNAGITLKSAAPDFATYSVYKENESGFVDKMSEKITDSARKAAFREDMLAAYSDSLKVAVARRYYEFADAVHSADVELMASAANYTKWAQGNFMNADSNWAWAISGYVDKVAPTAEFETVENTDGTEDVKVNVKAADTTGIKTLKYQFAAADADISVNTVNDWTEVESVSGTEMSFTASTAAAGKTSGEYALFVYTEDTEGNKQVVKSELTVTVNSDVNVICNITNPEGKVPYEAIAGVTADIYGTAYGKDIYAEGKEFTVYAVIDDSNTKSADDTDWGEAITGEKTDDINGKTAYRYAMPEKKNVSGYYYLHILYTFKNSKGDVQKNVVNKAYALDGGEGVITINQTGSSDEGIMVEISATKATEIKYAVTAAEAAEPTAWQTYTAELNIKSADYANMDKVWVWAKSGDNVQHQEFNLDGNNKVSGPVAKPSLRLLDIIEENGARYAVIRLDDISSEALCVGAEYSAAVQRGSETPVWQRWSPLESVVKVKIGDGSVTVLMKFRNGENETTAANYSRLEIAADAVGSGEDYTLIKRSTLREVNATTGVTLTFTAKSKTSETETIKLNGVYEKNGTEYVVSNVNSKAPTYRLTWSDKGNHIAGTSVAATVSSDENITVTDLTFKGKSVGASRTYVFRENGTAVFTIMNEAGNTATVTANVSWLVAPLNIDVSENYEGYSTYGEGADRIANGVKLELTPNRVCTAIEVDGNDVTDTLTFDVTRNGTYLITASDAGGNLTSKKVTVSGIVTEVAAPTNITLAKDGDKMKATVTGKYNEKNPVFDGKTVKETPAAHENGTYTIEKTFENNGSYNQYLTDSLGNTVLYTIKVTGLDRSAPIVKFPAVISREAASSDMSEAEVIEWIRGSAEITDDSEISKVELQGTEIKTSVPGAYTIVVAATDKAGNTGYGATTVYILPKDGMLIRDGNGVLFCSSSKDAALVSRGGNKEIVLDISRYDLFDLTGYGKVRNKEAKLYVTVKQGIFREGQMKYFGVLDNEVTVNTETRTARITLNASDLPGTGWYTIIVRNAEREREFTTFFINADAE